MQPVKPHDRVPAHIFRRLRGPMRFLRHGGIFRSDVRCGDLESLGRGTASRWSVPGQATSRRDGRNAPCSSSTMSSVRLFLDRVARQHCPSPLHRQRELNTHLSALEPKGDILTLQRRGHFYFSLTVFQDVLKASSQCDTISPKLGSASVAEKFRSNIGRAL